jgi:hypothetical protein
MEPNNLWGDLPLEATVKTPVSILKEQASLLTKATNGVLEGQVTSNNSGADINLRLRIIAPALGQYAFSILVVSHKIFLYPAQITDLANSVAYHCDNEEGFIGVVGKILKSPAVHSAIASLLAQSRSSDNDDLPF